jgi:hypothetical protein
MRLMLAVFALVVTFNSAFASTIPVYPVPPIGTVSGGWATVGATTINGGAAAVEMEARVAGVVAKIPATARLGSTAASVGLAAIRLNPVGLATSAILQYLLQAGIQPCLQPGGWCAPATSPHASDPGFDGFQYLVDNGNGVGDSPGAAVTSAGYTFVGIVGPCSGGGCVYVSVKNPAAPQYGTYTVTVFQGGCVAGYVYSSGTGTCGPNPNAPATQAANDANWNKALIYPMPDQVATDLSAAKVPLPVTLAPSPTPITINLSDPYVDPITGKRYRDVAVVTPNADGKTATLNVVKQEVDANGNTATQTNASGVVVNTAPEKQDDPCTGHETRMGCAEEGQIPDAPDLKEQQINVAITPDGGWGPDNASCPADVPFTVMGRSFAISWAPVCSFGSMIRPLVIAMGWLAAAFIVVGAKQGGGE